MHKSRLIELFAHPDRVTPEDQPGLADWAQRYPFAAAGWMLLARASALAGSVDEQRDLLRASSHLGLRRPLYDLMHLAPSAPPAAAPPAAAPDPVAEAPAPEPAPVAEATAPVAAAPAPEPAPVVEAPASAPASAPEPVPVVETPVTPDLKSLEQDWLVAAVARSIEVDVIAWSAARAEEEASVAEGDEVVEVVEAGEFSGRAEPHAKPEKEGEMERPGTAEGVQGHSPFAQWLLSRAHGSGFGLQEQIGTKAAEPQAHALPSGSDSIQGERPDTAAGKADRVQGPAAPSHPLIQRFIEKSPRIGPIRDVGSGVEDWARKSIEEEGEVITETMARVLAEQGATARARRLYKLLGDRYPEKRVYFATLARELGRPGGKEGEEG